MGWSLFKPVARTDSALGPALPAGAALRPGPGAEMWEGWVFSFFFEFFVFRASEIPELITLFLILVGGLFFYVRIFGWRVEKMARSGWMSMKREMKNVGPGSEGDQGQTKVGSDQEGLVPLSSQAYSLFKP